MMKDQNIYYYHNKNKCCYNHCNKCFKAIIQKFQKEVKIKTESFIGSREIDYDNKDRAPNDVSELSLELDSILRKRLRNITIAKSKKNLNASSLEEELHLTEDEVIELEKQYISLTITGKELFDRYAQYFNKKFKLFKLYSGIPPPLLWYNETTRVQFPIYMSPVLMLKYEIWTQNFLCFHNNPCTKIDYNELRHQVNFEIFRVLKSINFQAICERVFLYLNQKTGANLYLTNNEKPPYWYPISSDEYDKQRNFYRKDLVDYFWSICSTLQPNYAKNSMLLIRVSETGVTSLEKINIELKTATLWCLLIDSSLFPKLMSTKTPPIRIQLNNSVKLHLGSSCKNFQAYYDKLDIGAQVPFPNLCFHITSAKQSPLDNKHLIVDSEKLGLGLTQNPYCLAFICSNEYVRNELFYVMSILCILQKESQKLSVQKIRDIYFANV